jgi:hypothetical protein
MFALILKGSMQDTTQVTRLNILNHTLNFLAAVEPSPLIPRAFIGQLDQPWMIDADDYGAVGEMNDFQGN